MADTDRETDPYREPENSTVENWHGQRVERDAELADELVADADGDEEVARGPLRRGSRRPRRPPQRRGLLRYPAR